MNHESYIQGYLHKQAAGHEYTPEELKGKWYEPILDPKSLGVRSAQYKAKKDLHNRLYSNADGTPRAVVPNKKILAGHSKADQLKMITQAAKDSQAKLKAKAKTTTSGKVPTDGSTD